jgi:Glycosyl transferase family 11
MELVVRESGGLGNQLFQYAAGKYYARRYGAVMRIAVDPEWNAFCNGYPRPCLLSHFSITAPMGERSLSDRIIFTDKAWLEAASDPFKRAFGIQVIIEQPQHRFRFLPDLPLKHGVKRLYIGGYFQTHFLVDEVADELRLELAFKDPAQGRNLELLEQITRSRNPVSLHVRRGDSVLAVEGKIVLPMEYYVDAISMIKEHLVDPTFFVFSDDIPFVQENLPRDARMVFVGHNDDFAAHEDLRLMSSCHHHVIANSTFSWWGAWLNPRPEKLVIAPRNWYLGADRYYPELLPHDWVLADVAGVATSA